MDSHRGSGQTTHEFDIQANRCQGISVSSVPNHRLPNVDHISIDADVFWSEPFDRCNITVHEIPNCMDPPLIEKEIQHRKGVSECAERRFAPFDQVWVKLNCEETGGHHRLAHYYRPASINATHVPVRNGTMARVAGISAMSHSRPMEKSGKRVSRGLMG
ncbi:hypothetical protein LTS12_029408 [Elasticomyces elasticus]|nr:hypothetical protein LTS12_029408 [Elasticomyces elasticus]